MKQIVAINASPRPNWNTGTLVQEAANGACSAGAETTVHNLYQIGHFTGCISCFGCKLPNHRGSCICQDALTPILERIRYADGLILGTPIYLGNTTSGFRSFYERLLFQFVTYKTSPKSYNTHRIPVLLIMTSNAPVEFYPTIGYDEMVSSYQRMFDERIGPTKILLCGNTLQVPDYQKYDWSLFDSGAKIERHNTIFPEEKKVAFQLGAELI